MIQYCIENIRPKDSVDPDQTASSGTVWSCFFRGSLIWVYTVCLELSQYIGSLHWLSILIYFHSSGASNFCLNCGHGGHTDHLLEWFKTQQLCPTGCGCNCMKMNPFWLRHTMWVRHWQDLVETRTTGNSDQIQIYRQCMHSASPICVQHWWPLVQIGLRWSNQSVSMITNFNWWPLLTMVTSAAERRSLNAMWVYHWQNYVPHRRGGGHIVFGADPVGVGVSVDTFLFARYLMNRWVDFN